MQRNKHQRAYSYRVRHPSDDDKSESGSDQEYVHTNFGSPDSGYSASPITFSFRDRYLNSADHIYVSSPTSSPLTVNTVNYPSPLYYSTFDRLSVNSFSPLAQETPEKPERTISENASTPSSPNKRRNNTENIENKSKTPKKPKAARKINFDEDTSSPVSGTIIRNLLEGEEEGRVVCGDIDSKFNCVEVTPEAKAEIEKIDNKIGDYICQLCKELYEDAFQLAQHRCSRIVHIEYRCPECEKVFNCPANLASHRRWHKPRPANSKPTTPAKILPAQNVQDFSNPAVSDASLSPTEDGQFSCDQCSKKFRRQAYLRKHLKSHVTDAIFVCKFCSKVFPNDNARAKHEVSHTSGKELTCTLCNSEFPNKIVLEKHVRHHEMDSYRCKFCTSTFCSSPGLTRHINKCHPTENRQVILLQLPVNRPC